MLQLSQIMRESGFDMVRFNFPYREAGAKVPDRMPKLQMSFADTVRTAVDEVNPKKLVIGGRSMGGRVASMLAAEGFACDGLLMLAYPLHPAGQAEKLRNSHLAKIRVPVLCINGTRDALCDRVLMERSIANLGWQMHWLEGKNHSFPVTREIGEVAARWLERL